MCNHREHNHYRNTIIIIDLHYQENTAGHLGANLGGGKYNANGNKLKLFLHCIVPHA